MSFLKKLSKSIAKGAKSLSKLSINPIDRKLTDETFRRNNASPFFGHFDEMRADKAAAEAGAKTEKANQLALLQRQQNAAENSLADLSLLNTPDVIAGGTANTLSGTRRRKRSGSAGSISTQLGV